MIWSIDLAPLVSPILIGILGAIGFLLVAVGIPSRPLPAILRMAALACLVLALLNPSLRREDREELPDIGVMVVDQSQSQSIGKRSERTTEAAARLTEEARRLGNFELRTVTAFSGVNSGEDGTRLFAALKQALAEIPPERYAGAVLITDGQVHDVPKAAAEIGYDGPLHALISGDRNERDRRVVVEAAPRFAIVGQSPTVSFRVEESGNDGSTAPAQVTVSLGGTPIASMEARPGESVELPVAIDHGGQNLIEIAVEPLEGELTDQNNRAVVVTEGVRDRLRVLLISGEPHPGERTWRNLLKADASVDLVHFTILRPPEKQDGTPINELSLIAFPTRELFVEKLSEFDLIIFDRYQRRGVLPLAYLANVADYVESGGAVLVAAGPQYASPISLYRTPLSGVLSAIPTGSVTEVPFRPVVTEKGRRHPVTRGLSGAGPVGGTPTWGRWLRIVDSEIRNGDIVMAGPEDKPLMVLSRQGEGRVAQVLSDHEWLWARGYDGGGPQAEMLRRLAHWLMKEPELEEEALVGRQDRTKLVVERRTMSEEAAPVTVTSPSGRAETLTLQAVEPGIWRAEIDVREAGIYRLGDGKLEAVAAVGSPDPRETAAIHATEDLIAPIARATGGGISWLVPAVSGLTERLAVPRPASVRPGRAMSGSGWIGFKANGAYRIRAVGSLPLFGTLFALAALLALLSLTWYREGR